MSTDHSGSSTSKAAAEHRQKRRTEARQLVYLARSRGLTVKELREALGEHHGVASSMLSALHRESQIARLSETRDRCHVYVSPLFVNRRDTQPYGGRAVERDFAIKQVERIQAIVPVGYIDSPGTLGEIARVVYQQPGVPF